MKNNLNISCKNEIIYVIFAATYTLIVKLKFIAMKKLLSLGLVALFAVSFASCKKCYDCSYEFLGTTTTSELCSGDGVSGSELDDAVSTLEAFGYTCTKQ